MVATFSSLQKPTASQLNTALSGYIIARAARRTASSTTTTAEIGVLRLDAIPVVAGRAYLITTCGLNLSSSVAGDAVMVRVRAALGSTATTSSGVVEGGQLRVPCQTSASSPILPLVCRYYAASSGALSLILTVQRSAGTGNVSIFADSSGQLCELVISDANVDPGDTGVVL